MGRPDFICVGLQKGSTRWLYLQLSQNPAFWMPPLKELHFWDAPFPSQKGLQALDKRPLKDPRAKAFAERVRALPPSREHGVAVYRSLFEMAGDRITGDVTPGYSTLGGAAVEALARDLPGTRVLLMLRDPVDRAWSHLNDAANSGQIDAAAVRDPAALVRALQSDAVRRRSHPVAIWRRWSRHFPMHATFFEDVVERPEAAREGIAAFLGAPPGGPWGAEPASNPKAGRARAERTPEIRAALVAHFRSEILEAAELFGGPAAAWPAKHGLT